MKITIQFFDGCPHWELGEQRLRQALADIGHKDVQVTYKRIDSTEDAERFDFHGSPTFLVNGRVMTNRGGVNGVVVSNVRSQDSDRWPRSVPSRRTHRAGL